MILGCIADDFTGATDLAGLLRRSGASVQLHFGLPDGPSDGHADIEIVALKCRTETVDTAVADCTAAGRWLLAGGAQQLYWKYCSTFDSTATGNIGPVSEALMALSGKTQAVYCPAFPENGRSVYMGHLFVGQQLLSESSLKDHPLTPMTDSNLIRVLSPQVAGRVALWSRADQRSQSALPDAEHIIADAVEFDDLEQIVASLPNHVMLTGGSALAMPLPARLGLANHQPEADPQVPGRSLVLSGSCSEMTRRQVAHWSAERPSYQIKPGQLGASDIAACLAWLDQLPTEQTALIYATDDPAAVRAAQSSMGVAEAGSQVESALSQIAQAAYARGYRRFVVAGGETSGAVAQALGVRQVRCGPEICPGVPWTFAGSASDPVALALKSGNFGQVSFFDDALKQLELADGPA